eukprot:Seg2246.2 transcript_id=Seg2246.2/GoldUCD/mRNA.D3Y31 product="hypothetical protein" protein_id=Seg2246.2/GoldUCD/D3Y31
MSNLTSTGEEEHTETAIAQQIHNQPNELSAPDDPCDISMTRNDTDCQNCRSYKKILIAERKHTKEVRKSFKMKMRELRNRNSRIRALAQKCKRQRERIKELKKGKEIVKGKREDSEKIKVMRKDFVKLQNKVSQLERNNKRNKLNYIKSRRSLEELAKKKGDTASSKSKIEIQSAQIRELQVELDIANEKLNETEESHSPVVKEQKKYSTLIRNLVYDALVNQVPTANVSNLLQKFGMRLGKPIHPVPHRTTIEQMARELGIFAQLQTAQEVMHNECLTLAFDATTQEGVHVNAVVVTTKESSYVIAVDRLPGGTAEDYALHVTNSVNELAEVYNAFHPEISYQDSRKEMISNINNTMTDRVAANHAAVRVINDYWGKSLNELNCHLHPLDSVSSCCRSALKKEDGTQGTLFGKDCIAGNIVLQVNKLRYKDGKGDPQGFVTFLDRNNMARGILPRFRGNRLHIVFHLCGIYVQHHDKFIALFKDGTSCGGLRKSILQDFTSEIGKTEMTVLGLFGKLLTGPWMTKFYVSPATQTINYVEGIEVVKDVVILLEQQLENPDGLLSCTKDFFGNQLDESDPTLEALKAY